MARPPLPVGTYGKIRVLPDGEGFRARASFRDYSGRRRDVARWGPSATRAELALKQALTELTTAGQANDVRADTRFSKLTELWLADVDAGALAHNTREAYRGAALGHLVPALGGLRVREIDVVAVNRALRAIQADHGPGSAKTARSVLSSILGLAVDSGAVPANPVRDARRISQPRKERPRALTRDDAEVLLDKVRSDEEASAFDVPDLIEWMLGTGMRIGEVCCVRDAVLGEATIEVNATMVRIKGRGLHIQKWTKTDPGWRVLALPEHLPLMLERRRSELRVLGPEGVAFASPRGMLRDGSNTAKAIRGALDRAGFDWVVPHTFRKTVATWMDEAGCTAREIADQLGHARPSLTQDVYMGRRVVTSRAAEVLAPSTPNKLPKNNEVIRHDRLT